MKRRLIWPALLAAVAITLLALTGCGGSETPATLPATPSPSPTPSSLMPASATPATAPASVADTPPTATPAAATTATSAPTLTPTPTPTPITAAAATPGRVGDVIIVTLAPPPPEFFQPFTTPGATPTASPSPTPAPPATIDDVPPTDGPVSAEIMPSRAHFAATLRIGDVEPGGYSTIPPTSGRHWDAWSACGFYNYPLPDELLVHNLEHGNIVISYNLPDADAVAELRAAVAAVPLAAEFAIVRRYPALPPGMVALTVWGALDRMLGVDAGRIASFFEQYPGTAGPEFANGLPCTTGAQMTPSSGG